MADIIALLLSAILITAFRISFDLGKIRDLLQRNLDPPKTSGIRTLLTEIKEQLETITRTLWGANDDRRDIRAIQREMLAIQEKKEKQ